MILSKCAIYGSKKARFIKSQDAKGLLSNLGIRTPLEHHLASMVYNFFDKKSIESGIVNNNNNNNDNNDNNNSNNNNDIKQNLQLAKELHKPIIRKLKKRKVYSGFKDNICSADLADMQLMSKVNKGFRFLLCVIDIFSKYAPVVPLKDKKGISIVNAFQKTLDNSLELHSTELHSERKPNKI